MVIHIVYTLNGELNKKSFKRSKNSLMGGVSCLTHRGAWPSALIMFIKLGTCAEFLFSRYNTQAHIC
jgi:hypothetical protein